MPPPIGFTFGDSPELCARLLTLVRQGRKTATCGALRDYAPGGDPMPVLGRQDIALNWDDTPALIIETTEVTVRRFCDVDASFALAEGENDSLDGWRTDHRAYFERNGGWDNEMLLVCERFGLVRDLAADQTLAASTDSTTWP
jgi:uncharacterized protein YhfF